MPCFCLKFPCIKTCVSDSLSPESLHQPALWGDKPLSVIHPIAIPLWTPVEPTKVEAALPIDDLSWLQGLILFQLLVQPWCGANPMGRG